MLFYCYTRPNLPEFPTRLQSLLFSEGFRLQFGCFPFLQCVHGDFIRLLELLVSEFYCAFVLCAHAQVVKRVVGLYDDGSIKPFRETGSRLCAQVLLRRLPGAMWGSQMEWQ